MTQQHPNPRDLIKRLADELDHYRQLLMDDRRETHAFWNNRPRWMLHSRRSHRDCKHRTNKSMTDTFRALCAEVLAFNNGESPYNFSGLTPYDRDNAAFDAWQDIRQRLKSALRLSQPEPEGTITEPRGCPTPGACSCPTAPYVPPELIRALELAEATLADIGDAEREPGDDLAWAESRAAQDLPRIRAVLARWGRSPQ